MVGETIIVEVSVTAMEVPAIVMEIPTIERLTRLVFPKGTLDVVSSLSVFLMRRIAISDVFQPLLEFASRT